MGGSSNVNNRYLILIPVMNDKGRIPLVLKPQQEHKPGTLKNAIQRLATFSEHVMNNTQQSFRPDSGTPSQASTNPEQKRNYLLKKRLLELKEMQALKASGGKMKTSQALDMKLQLESLKRRDMGLATEIDETRSRISETHSSMSKYTEDDVEELRTKLSELSIAYEKKKKENKKMIAKNAKEIDSYVGALKSNIGEEKKQ